MANRLKPLGTDIPEAKPQKVNRGEQVSRKKDKVRNISVGLQDIDTTIMYYFNEVIKPDVLDGGDRYKVPIRYASAERWKSVQSDGFLRSPRGQILLPVIVYRRTSTARDETIPVDSMDNHQLKYTFESRYSNKNRYDKFSAQYGLKPKKELYSVAVPDYQVLTYDVVVWTEYISQLNGIIEKVVHSEGKYWGKPGKFRFRNKIDSIEDATELTSDGDRMVKATFSMTFNGYLMPEDYDYEVLTQKSFTTGKVVIEEGNPINKEDIFK